jgi:hypothetical protein
MSISAFFTDEAAPHPYFNTIPDSFPASSNLDRVVTSFDPSTSLSHTGTGYPSVIIPNTIDDFLATHQVRQTRQRNNQRNTSIPQAILLSGLQSDFSLDFVELLCVQVDRLSLDPPSCECRSQRTAGTCWTP